MKAIKPIYDDRLVWIDSHFMNSEDIQQCLYSVIHEKLQELKPDESKRMSEAIADEIEDWGSRKAWYTDLITVLYEIKMWAYQNDYPLRILHNENMEKHMSLLGLKDVQVEMWNSFDLKERAVIYTTPQAFHELLFLLSAHWGISVLYWDIDYDIGDYEKGLEQRLTFGPIQIYIDPDWQPDELEDEVIEEFADAFDWEPSWVTDLSADLLADEDVK